MLMLQSLVYSIQYTQYDILPNIQLTGYTRLVAGR